MEQQLQIQLSDLYWIQNTDDPDDLCAHGNVLVKIDDEVIIDKEQGLEVTVSATALYLMRTLEEDYTPGDFGSQLLPCCGHFIIADEVNDFVTICGCPSGIDWIILHINEHQIKHIFESGHEVVIEKEQYIKQVLNFADAVADFYKISQPKRIPEDDFDRKGYLTFWKEWQNLREQWK